MIRHAAIFLLTAISMVFYVSPVDAKSYTFSLDNLEKIYDTKDFNFDRDDRSYGYEASQQWVNFDRPMIFSEATFEFSGTVLSYPSYEINKEEFTPENSIHYFMGINSNPASPPAWSGTWSLGSFGTHSNEDDYSSSIGEVGEDSFYLFRSINYGEIDHEMITEQVGGYLDFYIDFDQADSVSAYGQYNITDVQLTLVGKPVAPVPEPSTILLLGSGLAGVLFYTRKRKDK